MLNQWSRRKFMGRTALGGGAVISGEAALAMLTSTRVWAAAAAGDLDVLNFALTLEYLEADFYAQGNAAGIFTEQKTKDLFALIGSDEQAHVQALTDTITKLGGQPVAKPTVKYPDGTFKEVKTFVTTSKTFEEVGVGAYLGQAGAITDPTILQAAAGIFGVECRHAALVGKLAGLQPEGGIYMGATETAKSKDQVLAAVKPFLS
ncbi:MAG: twin-arginine translocation pathway signal [Candidatus Nephthysia bennettiae]|uniref:Ferritin-like domain-containing protein n=1 Tax=Candidatus Nephthysia bennettiae TaxID=3127016 RepID=A0A934JZC9_9BACT|nr:ferritin-like domain-containing protein [Candidatus Dormibacteraeota bacterium]PZR94221.1 MAG: twin-arginine translocation pathway signal [Candidatus Dormibacteraeota bacterium]